MIARTGRLVPLALLLAAAAARAAAPVPALPFAPRALVCPRAVAPPHLDGVLDDPAWRDAPRTAPFVDIRGGDRPDPRYLTTAAMAWDDSCLYVAATLQEPHVWATLTTRDAVIYHDNDFEVFLDPDGDNHLYYELEINALGTVWDLLLVRPYRDGGPAVDAWDIPGLRTAVAVDGTLDDPRDRDTGWSVEMAIPWAALAPAAGRAAPPAAGDVWRANFSRVQWRTRVEDGRYVKIAGQDEDNWVWSPQGLVAMHHPEMWGEVLFTDAVPADAGAALRAAPEHEEIRVAQLLMAVYHRQRQHRAATGAWAGDLADLGFPAGRLPVRALPGGAPPEHVPLPEGWRVSLDACGDGWRARLDTPDLVVTVDDTGRLRRERP